MDRRYQRADRESRRKIKAIGEVGLPDLMTRPDYAVTRDGSIGLVEVKAPGKGSDPTAFPAKSADRLQWEKLKSLPNILYGGKGLALWRDGRRVRPPTCRGMSGRPERR